MNDQSKFWPPWAIADLAKSGLTVEQVEAVGWAMVPPQDYAGHLGFAIPGAPEAYAIPFRDPVTGEPMKTSSGRPYVRLKFERPVHLGEKSAKYMSPQGSGNRAYIPREAHEAAARGEPLLLTEGEKKALCACRNNLPCIGLVGIGTEVQQVGCKARPAQAQSQQQRRLAFMRGESVGAARRRR